MVLDSEVAKVVAKSLLQIKAIELSPKNPFTWASGIKSPIYCDNRIILSHPKVRSFVCSNLSKQIKKTFPEIEIIAGVATGAIGIAALVAQDLGLPMVYVRSASKGHGRKNLIEGHLESGKKVIVVEDLISTGMSSLKAVNSIKESGGRVMGMSAIFTYGFQESTKAFNDEGCKLITLSDFEHLLKGIKNDKSFSSEDQLILDDWRKNPQNWHNIKSS
jgi:orotate phosphoribosyltransferase